jgi:hypothetical protein
MTARLIALPPSPKTAHRVACHLRSAGFFTLPELVWNGAADLVEHLTDQAPTSAQLMWLWRAHEKFLLTSEGN